MTSIERVRAALAGGRVDRPPFSIWYHFGLQHAPAERTAQAHLEFLDAYHLDWLKVMNDYSYPMPDGVETLADARDLARLRPFDVTVGPPGEQLKVNQGFVMARIEIERFAVAPFRLVGVAEGVVHDSKQAKGVRGRPEPA